MNLTDSPSFTEVGERDNGIPELLNDESALTRLDRVGVEAIGLLLYGPMCCHQNIVKRLEHRMALN
jgi:hypothetical protein